ncbi:MAG: hypothetical protein ACLQSX_00850 [Smithella sp.]
MILPSQPGSWTTIPSSYGQHTPSIAGQHVPAATIGMLARIEHYHDKLPETWHYINSVAETRESYAVRRIWLAAQQYMREGSVPAKWQLIRKAGIRDDLMPAIMTNIDRAYGIICKHI